MVFCCCPGCSSSSNSGDKVSFFTFPRELDRQAAWMRQIPRTDWTISKNTRICSKHFDKRFIVTEDVFKSADGSEIKLARSQPKLRNDAIPTLFENLPTYCSKKMLPERKPRQHTSVDNPFVSFEAECAKDEINISRPIFENIKADGYFPTFKEEGWAFYNISTPLDDDKNKLSGAPFINCSFSIDRDFKVNIFKNKIKLSPKVFPFLDQGGRCTKYSTLNKISDHLLKFEFENHNFFKEQINIITHDLDKLIENEQVDEIQYEKLKFLKSQLQLICCKSPRYSLDTLIFSMLFFTSYPAGYRFLRDNKILTLPSPNYLSSFNKGNIQTGAASNYLVKQFSYLEPHEKYVNLMLDEIYVKPQISFKGDNILGVAENLQNANTTEAATTVQVIMISSLLSKYTDVVGLYPIKRLDAHYLANLLEDVMIMLHNIGFEVIDVISDNNAVNSKSFKMYAKSDTLPYSIINRYIPGNKRIFFTFDPPHILKCLRNIFQKVRVFHFESHEMPGSFRQASIADLEKVYELERFSTVKLAPQLSHKVLHTSNLDKQNVYLATCLFNRKNIEALNFYKDQLGPHVNGTIEFLTIIVNLWDILNVKSVNKGNHLRNEFMKPINNVSSASILFLIEIVSWFKKWYASNKPNFIDSSFYNDIVRVGKLTRETHTAITHTIDTLISITEYLLTDAGFNGIFKYILFGNFSTDKLEFLFSLYRKMSGHNYHVSVRQIVESQKKLNCIKALKLKQTLQSSLPIKIFLKEFSFSDDFSICPIDEIDDILHLASDMTLSTADTNVIIYIAGFIAGKTADRLKCSSCNDILLFDKNIVVEFSTETDYLRNLDRGGLKYPSDFSTEIGIRAIKAFRALTSERFEALFIKCKTHKHFLYSLITEFVECLAFDLPADLPCEHSALQIIDISVCIWVNIFLNNYTKELNDVTNLSTVGASTHYTSDLTKRRKLSTFRRPYSE